MELSHNGVVFDMVNTMTTHITPGQSVGRTLRRVRESVGDTQTSCARKTHAYGMTWNHSHVSALERGDRATVTIEELVVLSSIYELPIPAWFAGDEDMAITKDHSVPLGDVRDLMTKKRVAPMTIDFATVEDYSADERIAKRLGVSQDEVTKIAIEMWGHHATAERERRLSEHRDKTPSEMRTLRAGMTKHLAHQIKLRIEESA